MIKDASAVPSRARKTRGIHRAVLKRAPRDVNPPAAADEAAAPGRSAPDVFPPERDGGQQPGAGAAPRPASRRALKNWRVRSRLLLLVIIPTVTAVAAGGIFIASSVASALAYQRVLTLASLSGKITGLVQALQNEREDTIRFIVLGNSDGGRGAAPSSVIPAGPEIGLLNQDYAVTAGWADQVKALADGIDGSYSALALQDTQAALTAIGNLPAIRAAATGTQLPALIVIGEYATAIDTLLAVESQIAVGSGDSTLAGSVRVLGLVSSMKEEASQQQALLTSALRSDLVSLGQFGPAQQSAITDAQAQQQGNLNEFGTAATADQRQLFTNVLSSSNVVQAQAQEQQAISLASSKSPIATDPTISDASSALSYVTGGLRSVELQFANSVISRSGSLHDGAITSAVIFSLAVALLLGIALTATIVVARSMVGPLRRLRNGAFEVAAVRLPEVVRRMSESDGEDVPTEVEPINVDSSDEIGEVARAFDQVHQEAVRLAGNEAMLRGNVSAMFISLSRRSVPLIERLARMIDSMELAEDDPDRLSDLFSMDHLVTRMRRNSENLLVLAGEEPVRKWGEPVPLADVVRAATSEIEQYSRVQLNIQPAIVVSGQAAADVVHLLAEIIENATIFSPRDTPVHISGHELTSGGVLLEVKDAGIGIPPSRLSQINWRLDNPPLIDVSVSQHMGLFAVSRLAARHGVRIRLRAATPKGLSALVWLPGNLTGRETAQHRKRSLQLAEDSSFVQLRVGGRRTPGRHAAPGPHAADGGGRDGAEQATAGAGRTSNWFRAKRPSSRGARGTDVSARGAGLSVAAAGMPAHSAADTSPQAMPGIPAHDAPDGTARSAPGLPARQPPGPDSWTDHGVRAAETARTPVRGDRTAAGLPSRIPGANLIPGSAGRRTADGSSPADGSAMDQTQASGGHAGGAETEQLTPPRRTPPKRRTPELARNRLSGFQLGSREAEAGTPSAGEGSSH
ncbi:MAG: nitrate- and nitrite sensing domain-containing protein [Streptosporangiaceae bacterium]|nr:nitrate- and nitrite sensing domain-containing protein [Streptosporangiaceae bacterium]